MSLLNPSVCSFSYISRSNYHTSLFTYKTSPSSYKMKGIVCQNSSSSNISRPSANFHTSVWGDHFIQYASNQITEKDAKMEEHITILKEKVRKMLVSMNEKESLSTKANLIDSIQRLGLDYHFELEIDQVLQHIHNNCVESGVLTLNEDIYVVALVFRLLRQHGYHISSDVFNKFKDEEGNFSQKLIADVKGMLNLYEAAHLRTHGEEILDEALDFTSTHLELISSQLSPSVCAYIRSSLKRPLLKNLPILVARSYISTYEENPDHDETLLLFAKLDFNMRQKQHQKEIAIISKWWKDCKFATKLPFVRDRVVECYFWSLGVYPEPQYSFGRILMSKILGIGAIIDDTYDAYGTMEELQLFTEAIKRWDISNIDFLPEYMKFSCKALFDVYEEIEKEVAKEGREFSVTFAKNECIRMVEAYFTEAKWFNSNYIPTMEEYMDVAEVTVGIRFITAVSFIGMGSIATEKTFQWVKSNHKIGNASIIICRLMDDIVTSEFEQKRGHVVSAIECYMKQHSATRQDTINEFQRQVANAWKVINGEFLNPIEVAKPLLMRILNLLRVMDVLYKDGDGFTHSKGSTKKHIEDLLLNPLPIEENEVHRLNNVNH